MSPRASRLTAELVESALANTAWDVGNQALYDLCRKHPGHTQPEVIIGKFWLIGRTYAAAVERRRQKDGFAGDRFYTEKLVPAVSQWRIDEWISAAKKQPDNLGSVLRAHGCLTDRLHRLTGVRKPSLASKYLHFHVPDAFFIFDSRAVKGVRTLKQRAIGARRSKVVADTCHRPYATFYLKCLELTRRIESLVGRRPTPREVDKVLLFAAAGSQRAETRWQG